MSGVEGGIVTGQVTASLDGLTRAHLALLSDILVAHAKDNGRTPLATDLLGAIAKAKAEWDIHDDRQQLDGARVAPEGVRA